MTKTTEKEKPTTDRYNSRCIVLKPNGLFVTGNSKETENIDEARVFRNPSAAWAYINANFSFRVKDDCEILPVKLVQIGKPLQEYDRRWYKG